MATPERSAGFTLVEMLVALLIAGMALALTTQALGQYQRAHTRAIASERIGREYRLSESWFRESVRGLLPAAPDTAGRGRAVTGVGMAETAAPFQGDGTGFAGITLSPVLAGQGVPVLQQWQVKTDGARTRLQVTESGQVLQMILPQASAMRLHYVDRAGDLHDTWPPELGQWPQLPAAVVFELQPAATGPGLLVAAAVLGPADPLGPIESAYELAPP